MKGYRFLRQRPILYYIADFFCKELKLVIEVDGYSHLFKVDEDKIRDKKLNLNGYEVLRVFEEDVMHDFENVVREIEYTIENIEREPGFKGEGKR